MEKKAGGMLYYAMMMLREDVQHIGIVSPLLRGESAKERRERKAGGMLY